METLWPQIERLLPTVSKPARYIGGEQGAVYPEHGPGKVAWLLIYPDTYEIGLPNQGLQILYEILNERPDALAERAYAPWVDMEAAMRAAGVPLFSVEQHLPAAAFDVLAFNLSAELVYTNVVNLIDLAGLPLHAADRGGGRRARVAGGHCAFNPEPLADFVDAFVLGDGEEVVGEVNEVVAAWLAGAPPEERDRAALLRSLARLEGVYVPALYAPSYEDGRLVSTVARRSPGCRPTVTKRTVSDLADWPYPSQPLVPLTEVVHDRLNVEVFRGCTRGCRFCQAGMITRPVRERPAAQVREHGARRARVERLRRGDADLAVDGGLLGHRGHRARHRRRPRARRAGLGQPPVAAGGRVHRGHGRARSRRCAAPASPSHPRAARGGCAR